MSKIFHFTMIYQLNYSCRDNTSFETRNPTDRFASALHDSSFKTINSFDSKNPLRWSGKQTVSTRSYLQHLNGCHLVNLPPIKLNQIRLQQKKHRLITANTRRTINSKKKIHQTS